MRELARGENAPLTRQSITVSAAGVQSGVIDLMVFQLAADEMVRTDDDLIFFNAPVSKEGAVRLIGANIEIDLGAIPGPVQFLRVAVTMDDSVEGNLSSVAGLGITLEEAFGHRICAPAIGLATERSAVLLEIYRRGDVWKARNISAGWNAGLAALVTAHGVTVDEDVPPDRGRATVTVTKETPSAPASATPTASRTAAAPNSATAGEVVLTTYPVKKTFTVSRHGVEKSYDVPGGFEMLLIDLEHMFEIALEGTGIAAENAWWELGFEPNDEIDEFSVRRLTFTVRPGHTRPAYGVRNLSSENGDESTYAYRPDLDQAEWRGGIRADPHELRTLIYFTKSTMTHAVEDGYEFTGSWMFRIIEDPDEGKCVESFCEAAWTKPKRWRVSP
ncbi:TerD family protein [Nocardia tengchongensis]|uniref:TerD family protein n=1 Tax=Nocardia tengchongensis TaxID=2055889 RepID=UPI0036847026